MSSTTIDVKKIIALAHIATEEKELYQLEHDIHLILSFVDHLLEINTHNVAPLVHPLDLSQPLREDWVSEENQQQSLAKIAPLFEDNLYWVPKVLDK